MQQDLLLLMNWLSQNKLTLNTQKTKCMLISTNLTQSVNNCLNLKVNGASIEQVDSFKYLGLTIQSNLKWNVHVNQIINKINAFCGIINRIGNRVNNSVLTSIYYSHIHSHLTYLLPIWGPAIPNYLLDWLQICQNNAIRKIFAYDYKVLELHTNEIMLKNNILNVRKSLLFESATLYYKISHGLIKIQNDFLTHSDNHSYSTRNKNQPFPLAFRTCIGRDSVLRSTVVSFNKISKFVKKSYTHVNFRKNLKKIIADNQF